MISVKWTGTRSLVRVRTKLLDHHQDVPHVLGLFFDVFDALVRIFQRQFVPVGPAERSVRVLQNRREPVAQIMG